MIAIIAALTPSRVIGRDNALLWKIPEDMQNLKKLTTGNVLIMGRKTYESIGRPLPNRVNIVVSRTQKEIKGVILCDTLQKALDQAKTYEKNIFIFGGAAIYAQCIPLCDTMFLSHVKKEYEGDAFFPPFKEEEWDVIEEEDHEEYVYKVYKKKS